MICSDRHQSAWNLTFTLKSPSMEAPRGQVVKNGIFLEKQTKEVFFPEQKFTKIQGLY